MYRIYLAVSYNSQTRYISTEYEISDPSQIQNGKVCKRKDASAMNKGLREFMEIFRTRLYKLNLFEFPDCASLKAALMNKPQNTGSLFLSDLINKRITRFESEGRSNYSRMHRDSLKVYTSIIGDPLLSSISREYVKRLSTEMQKRGYSNGSRQIRLAHLKAALNEAISDGLVKYENHPFAGFTMPTPGRRQTDLTKTDFKRLRDADLKNSRAIFARDLFLLSFYLGGINLVDLLRVNLSGDELRYTRQKTHNKKNGDSVTTFTIPEPARILIKKYAPNGFFIWPGKANRYEIIASYCNNCFERLRNEINITPLSYYSARHTFGQFAFEVDTPLEVVEYLLGQSMKMNRPIFNYCRVMQRQADDAINKVLEYINTGV